MNRLVPESSLVLAIDLQERLVPAMDSESMPTVVRAVDVLLFAAQTLSVPVFITEQYPKGLGSTIPQVSDLAKASKATVFAKTCFSAWDCEPARAAIEQLKPMDIIVAGIESHVCVLQTVRDLRKAGFAVCVVGDGVTSRKARDCALAINAFSALGATVLPCESIAFEWLRVAEGDAFRAISKRVR